MFTFIPWLELSVGIPVLTIPLLVFRGRNTRQSHFAVTVACGLCFLASFMAWLGQYLGYSTGSGPWLQVDELSGPLVPSVAFLHFLTVFSMTELNKETFAAKPFLLALALRIAVFSCLSLNMLVVLLILCTIPPYFDLKRRNKPTRVYLLHMISFAMFMVLGWACVGMSMDALGAVLLILGVLIRSGIFPTHIWIPDLFENGSLTSAILTVTPLTGVYAAVRLVLPIAPSWLLETVTVFSLITAIYSSGLALVQTELRRFVAHLFISFASLVLVGLEVHTTESVTGAFSLWFSLMLATTTLGLVIRALEDRFGRMSLQDFHGYYERTPTLAVGFLIAALACVGFPGLIGYVSTEMLIDGTISDNPFIGVVLICCSALNGIAVLRAYTHLFTGRRYAHAMDLPLSVPERFTVQVLCLILIVGGLFPQPGITTRYQASLAFFLPKTPEEHK